MRVLVACERFGAVRRAVKARGHYVRSVDILPADDDSPDHYQGDARDLLDDGWDAIIAFPPCTYLTGSAAWAFKEPDFDRYPGVGYHQRVKPGTLTGAARRAARQEAGEFANLIWESCDRVALENPRGGLSAYIDYYDVMQQIQPYQFGHDASKATVLRLKGLPPLKPTLYVPPRIVNGRPRWGNQTDSGQNRLSPNDDDRAANRGRTYQGIAEAMADQWCGGTKSERTTA